MPFSKRVTLVSEEGVAVRYVGVARPASGLERQSGPPEGGRLEVGGAVLLHLRETWCAQPWNLEGERRRQTALCKLILS